MLDAINWYPICMEVSTARSKHWSHIRWDIIQHSMSDKQVNIHVHFHWGGIPLMWRLNKKISMMTCSMLPRVKISAIVQQPSIRWTTTSTKATISLMLVKWMKHFKMQQYKYYGHRKAHNGEKATALCGFNTNVMDIEKLIMGKTIYSKC